MLINKLIKYVCIYAVCQQDTSRKSIFSSSINCIENGISPDECGHAPQAKTTKQKQNKPKKKTKTNQNKTFRCYTQLVFS